MLQMDHFCSITSGMKHHLERINKLQSYDSQWNWQWHEFPLAIQKIDKLEKSNTGTAINVLLNSKKGIYTALGSEFNRTGGKQVNLSMIMDGEKDSTQQ